MTDGTSQGLFVVVAIVIFGIFVALSYTVFGSDGLSGGINGLFESGISQAEQSLLRPLTFPHTYQARSEATLDIVEGETYNRNDVYNFKSEGLSEQFSGGDIVTWFIRESQPELEELEGSRMEIEFYAKSDVEGSFWIRTGGAFLNETVRYSGETLIGDGNWNKYIYEFTVPEYETVITQSRAAFVMGFYDSIEMLITAPKVTIYR